MADAVRWMLIFVCLFNIGVMIGLFERVHQSFLPLGPLRLLFISNGVMLSALVVGFASRLHEPLAWQLTPAFALGVLAQMISLVALYRWFGSAPGLEHMRKIDGLDDH